MSFLSFSILFALIGKICAKHQWLAEHIIKTTTQKMDHKHGMLEYSQAESNILRDTFQETR